MENELSNIKNELKSAIGNNSRFKNEIENTEREINIVE